MQLTHPPHVRYAGEPHIPIQKGGGTMARRLTIPEIPDETDAVAYTIFLLDTVRECYERCTLRVTDAQAWLDIFRAIPRTDIPGREALARFSIALSASEHAVTASVSNAFERLVTVTPMHPSPREETVLSAAIIALWCAALDNDAVRLRLHARRVHDVVGTDRDAPWAELNCIFEGIVHPIELRGHPPPAAEAVLLRRFLASIEREFLARLTQKTAATEIYLAKLRAAARS